MANLCGVTKEDMPTLRVLKFASGNFAKFKYEGDWTQENIEDFFGAFENNEVKEYLKSEPVVDNTGKVVKQLVRNNFYEQIQLKDKITFVVFYADWCEKCKLALEAL